MSKGSGIATSRGTLLWLCHGPATVAPIEPLAWEIPYATGANVKRKKKKEKKGNKVRFNPSIVLEQIILTLSVIRLYC